MLRPVFDNQAKSQHLSGRFASCQHLKHNTRAREVSEMKSADIIVVGGSAGALSILQQYNTDGR